MVALIAVLAIVGIILMAIEIFIIPGFGVSGIMGIIALVAAIAIAADSVVEAIVYGLLVLVVLGIFVYIAFRSNRLQKRLFLGTSQTKKAGYVAPKTSYEQYIGRYGTAITPLRPAGTGDFNGERLDVVTEGSFIAKGARVKVLGVEGARIIVREVDSEQ